MPILSATLINRKVQPEQVGVVYAMLWLGCIISPFLGGQLVDRFMPSQIFLGISHLLAAVAAFVMANQQTGSQFAIWLLVWSLLFAPSLGITNSIAFQHIDKIGADNASQERNGGGSIWSLSAFALFAITFYIVLHELLSLWFAGSLSFILSLVAAPVLGALFTRMLMKNNADRERDFSIIRTAGTIGWIVAAFLLALYMKNIGADPKAITGAVPEMQLAGILGIVMAIYSFTLPNTPPDKSAKSDPFAFRKAFSLFKTVPGFGVFMAISFFAATEFQFFYGLSGQFLESKTIPHSLIPIVKSISQVAEIGALAVLLPMWLPSKGMRWCLLLGSFAWPIRYLIFSVGNPIWLVVLSLGLHGFGYAFVLVVQQLYVDRVSPKDIRGSAQSLLTFMTLGLGNVLGSLFAAKIQQAFTTDGHTNWVPVFILPTVTTLTCAIAYMLTFREPKSHEDHIGSAELKATVE